MKRPSPLTRDRCCCWTFGDVDTEHIICGGGKLKRASVPMLRPAAFFVLVLLATLPARGEDANAIKVDGTTYRLEGIDAPEADQNCINEDGELYPCGRRAWEELKKFIASRPIKCVDLRAVPAYPKRRIGQCSTEGIDLQHRLVLQGWALDFEPDAKGRFKTDEDDARAGRFGLWKRLLRCTPGLSTMEQAHGKTAWAELPGRCARETVSRRCDDAGWLRDQGALCSSCMALHGHLSLAGLRQLSAHEGQAMVLFGGRRVSRGVSQGVHVWLVVSVEVRLDSALDRVIVADWGR